MENLKLLVPMVVQSVSEMVEKWGRSRSGEIEIEVCEWFQRLTEDVIMRTVFGSWYKDEAIFHLQAQQMVLAAQALRIVSLPANRNLSRNKLTGVIPAKFGNLRSVLEIDLSNNHLSGIIP